MSWKIIGTAAAAVLALAACDTTASDRATSAAAARSNTGMSSASPTVGGTPMVGGPVNQSATTVAPAPAPAPMTAAERRRMEREERMAARRSGRMSERDRAYMGGGMVQSSGSTGAMAAPPASTLGNPSSVGGVGGSNTASTGPGGTAATGSGNQPGFGGTSQSR